MKIAAFFENIRTGAEYEGISVAEAVSGLQKAGLQGIYVSCESTQKYADELAEAVRETGVGIVGLHGWIDFDTQIGDVRGAIDRAAELGTDHLLIVPVCEGNDVEKLTAGMRDAVAYGREKGVRVCMEDVDQANYPTSTIAGLRAFLDRIPGLECCFDTGNWIMSGEDEVEAFKKTQDRISAMHLKDRSKTRINEDDIEIRLPDGSELYPAPVGKGYVRVAEILSMAGDWPVIAELYNCSPARMLEGIRASVEWIAAQIRT